MFIAPEISVMPEYGTHNVSRHILDLLFVLVKLRHSRLRRTDDDFTHTSANLSARQDCIANLEKLKILKSFKGIVENFAFFILKSVKLM